MHTIVFANARIFVFDLTRINRVSSTLDLAGTRAARVGSHTRRLDRWG